MLELGTIYTSKDIGCFMYWYINAFSLKFVFFKPPCETKTCIEFEKKNVWHHIMAKGTYSSPKFLSQMKKVVNRPTLMYIPIFCNCLVCVRSSWSSIFYCICDIDPQLGFSKPNIFVWRAFSLTNRCT